MEGSHRGGRSLKDVVVGSKEVAAAQRQRAQQGAAATGRRGQAVQLARMGTQDDVIEKEVERAMTQGTSLVQAAVEHLNTAERSWDIFLLTRKLVIDGYPTEKQVLTYMVTMSRERHRMCLAQRGTRRKGVQRNAVRNYVSEMANNLWATKYPAFGELSEVQRRAYWSKVFTSYNAMYAAASSISESEEAEERAEQLVAQTEEVYKRQHVQ
jgi:hypothetical protein